MVLMVRRTGILVTVAGTAVWYSSVENNMAISRIEKDGPAIYVWEDI